MKGTQRARDRRSSGRSKQRQQWVIVGVVAVVVVAGITALILSAGGAGPQVAALPSSPSSADLTEEVYAEQGRDHIPRGTAHAAYNSDPPTSGPHYADRPNMQQTAPGFYDETNAPLDEDLIHAEEHGYVIIWYDCAKAPNGDCTALKAGIQQVMAQLGGQKLVALPRKDMKTMLALTSWTKVQRLDAFDVAKITSFYKTHLNQAPEPGAL